MRRRNFLRAIAATGAAFAPRARAIVPAARIVIGFPPGGGSDRVARLLADVLRGEFADTVVVESRTGGGGTLAADTVRGSPADGSVLLVSPSTIFTLQPHTNPRLPFNPATDFTPVAGLALYGGAIAVGPKVPQSVRTLRQFAAWGVEHPNDVSYGSPGAGGGSHFIGFQLFRHLGLNAAHVAYRGNQPAVADLIGGQVAAIVTGIPEIVPHVRSGRARVLAVTLPSRSRLLPEAPTLGESGIGDIIGSTDVMGVYLPARTPIALVDRLSELARSAQSTPGFVQAYEQMAYEAHPLGPKALTALLERDRLAWGDVVRTSGFKPDA